MANNTMLSNKSKKIGNALLFAIPVMAGIGVAIYARQLPPTPATQANLSAATFIATAVFSLLRHYMHRPRTLLREALDEGRLLDIYFALLLFGIWLFVSSFYVH